MRVSVAIPVQNGGVLFRRCLDRLAAQDFGDDWEIVVADTCSTDGSRELLVDREDEPVPVRWFRVEPGDFGHGRTRNELAAFARGETVAFLTQDSVPGTENWLSELVETLEAFPEAAGVFGRHVAWPEHGPAIAASTRAHFEGFGAARACFRLDEGERIEELDTTGRQFLHFYSDNNSALRKSVWRRIPYPDVAFGEDQLWAEAILRAGYGKAYSPHAWVYHSHRPPFFEAIRRAREEAAFYGDAFGYTVGAPLGKCLRDAARATRAQWKSLRGTGGGGSAERWRTARDIFALHLGHHQAWRKRRTVKATRETGP